MRSSLYVPSIVTLTATVQVFAGSAQYAVQDLGLVGEQILVYSINNHGDVLATVDGTAVVVDADGVVNTIGDVLVSDINDAGWVCGAANQPGVGSVAALWTPTPEQTFDLSFFPGPEGSTSSSADAINNDGDIAGISQYNEGPLGFQVRPTLWADGGVTDLGFVTSTINFARDLNIHNHVVGTAQMLEIVPLQELAFDWSPSNGIDSLVFPAGAADTRAGAINDAGMIAGIGIVIIPVPSLDVIIWQDDQIVEAAPLPVLPAESADALGMNENGQVVGIVAPDISTSLGWFYDGRAASLLSDIVSNPGSWQFDAAVDIADDGTIAGHGTFAGESRAFRLVPVSESASDLNGDGTVGPADLAMLLGSWGRCPAREACPADINGDGSVGPADLAVLLGSWG